MQAVLLSMIHKDTILVGHSLESDLKATKVSFQVLQYVRDYMRHQCLTRLRSSYICIVLQRCMLLNGY